MSPDSRNEAVTLEAVISRFVESEKALNALQEKLKSIALSEEGAAKAAASLDQAAQEIGNLVESVRTVVGELTSSQRLTQSAMDAAQQFLLATDLGQVNEKLSLLNKSLPDQVEGIEEGLQTRFEGLNKSLTERFENFEKRLQDGLSVLEEKIYLAVTTLEEKIATIKQEEAQTRGDLKRITEALPGRVRKRIGP